VQPGSEHSKRGLKGASGQEALVVREGDGGMIIDSILSKNTNYFL